MQPDKREPILADKFIQGPQADRNSPLLNRKLLTALQGKVRSARRFILTDGASAHIGRICHDIPDLLVREQQFARPAYDLMWLEWNARELWRNANPNGNADATSDRKLGVLIDHGTVYTLMDAGNKVAIIPFATELHQPWELPDQLEFCEQTALSRIQLDEVMWGSTSSRLPEDQRRALRAHHGLRMLPFGEDWRHLYRTPGLQNLVFQCAGDVRNLIAMLLVLNRPSLTRYVRDAPHWRGFVRGKLRPYMSHTVVTIDIDPKPTLMLMGTPLGEGVPRRRHEVRNTWCHDQVYKKAKGTCIHEWAPHPDFMEKIEHLHYDEDGNAQWDNWQCRHCGGHRWWREKHERGDAALGYVDKEYRVTA